MAVDFEPTAAGFELQLDGRPRVVIDDLHLTAWGERHRLACDGLEPGGVERDVGHDEVGVHQTERHRFVTRSARNPVELRLAVRCYEAEPLILLELLPSVSQPVFGTEEAGGLRIGALAEVTEGLVLRQRVTEYGREAVGCWWAQAQFAGDITRLPGFDWGLFAGWRHADGTCGALVPMRAGGAVARLRGEAPGLGVVASGGCGRHVYPRLPLAVIAFAETPAEAVRRGLSGACRLGEWSFRLRDDKVYPELFESLGYATWGAFGRELTQAGIDEALRSLRDAGIPVRWLCLDEGWQEVNAAQQLVGFDADRRRFPDGLAAGVRQLQAAGGLRHVGCWLTLQGAWGGVDAHSPLGGRQIGRLVTGADGSRIPGARPADQAFWDDWFSHLSTSGLDFIKVDNQGSLRTHFFGQQALDDAADGLIGNVETAADAAGLHLGASMGLHGECYYHYTSTNVVRVSSDIAPDDRRAAKLHLVHSAHTAAWLTPIAWPDCDAFASTHVAARAFAVVAALLSGPIYLCDRPGRHDPDLARRLCLNDGRLLLPAGPGRLLGDRWFRDPLADGEPLLLRAEAAMLPRQRAYESVGASRATPVTFLGAVNAALTGAAVRAEVPLAELDLPAAPRYAVTAHFSGRRWELAADGALSLDLPELGAEVFAVAPLWGKPVALGLVDKLLGASGCAVDPDNIVSLPEPGLVLLHDEEGFAPEAIDYLRYTAVEHDRPLAAGECRRDGPWVEVYAKSTIFRLGRGD